MPTYPFSAGDHRYPIKQYVDDSIAEIPGGSLNVTNDGVAAGSGSTLNVGSGSTVEGPLPPALAVGQQAPGIIAIDFVGPIAVAMVQSDIDGGMATSQKSSRVTTFTKTGVGIYQVVFDFASVGTAGALQTIIPAVTMRGAGTGIRATATMVDNVTMEIRTFNAAGAAADGGFSAVFFV